MNKLNFDNMTRDKLAHYMVDHRDTPEAVEATRARHESDGKASRKQW